MESSLYFGVLRHRRFRPVEHQFRYRLFMAFLDVDRIPEVMARSRWSSYGRFNWASFHESDHFGDPSIPLRQRVVQDAAGNGVALSGGPIFLLTHLRYLGYNFNPISIFYCFDHEGKIEAVLAEVNSTFGERTNYWLPSVRHRCPKTMHVSPFHAMDLLYDFSLSKPGDSLVAHMETLDGSAAALFDATLTLERRPWTAGTLREGLLAHPWMTVKVIAAIHWQALKLYWKGAPVYTHPAKKKDENARGKAISKNA